MLKKLLTLSLVAVMLSTVALASNGVVGFGVATYAEEAETVTEEFGHAKYEILRVQPVSETTQKITKPTSNVSSGTTNSWYLVKVDIGKDWGSFTSITSNVRVLAARGKNYRYIISLTKADYDAALAAVGKTVSNFLTEPSLAPVNNEYMWKDGSTFSGYTSSQTPSLTLSEGRYTYSDGCLYFATQFTSDNATYPYVGMRVADTSKDTNFKTTVKGTKVEAPAVTDFSQAEIAWNDGTCTITNVPAEGTAMLIVASFNGTTMLDAKVATIDAEDAVDGVITETITDLTAGSSVKVFLWNPTTLVPAITPATF